MNDFQKIQVYSNWCYIDRLDGKEIVDGEPVDVRWPDGRETPEALRLQRDSFTICDMGHDYQASDHKAFVEIIERGMPMRVFLRGTEVVVRRRQS